MYILCYCVSVNVIEGASVSVCDSGCDCECGESKGKDVNRYKCECEVQFAELPHFKMARGIMPFAELSHDGSKRTTSMLQIPRKGDRSHNPFNWLCFLVSSPKGSS